jgi:hypothetical protein
MCHACCKGSLLLVYVYMPTISQEFVVFYCTFLSSSRSVICKCQSCRPQWPLGLKRRFVAARLLGLRVRTPPGPWMSVCCECFVLSGTGLGDGPILVQDSPTE